MIGLDDSSLFHEACLIGGEWLASSTGSVLEVTTPETQGRLGSVPMLDRSEVASAVSAAHQRFSTWSRTTALERSDLLRAWYELIVANARDLGRILSAEQGKPWAEGIGEIHYAASFIRWFSEEARRLYGDVIPSNSVNRRFLVLKQPIGVVALITPWNFPAAMITRKAGAALAAGCTAVIKPASATPFTALALADLGQRAGIPAGVLNVVTGSARVIGDELTENEKVRKLSFTGSTEVGRHLLAKCAATVKNVSMELGGNAPFIIFNDANLPEAVQGVMASKFRNAGQTCVCANRIFVQDAIYDAFAAMLAKAVSALRVGPTFAEGSEIGPLIDAAAVDKVRDHIDDAVKRGATVLTGGGLHALGGTYFQPTVLVGVRPGCALMHEETFGPLAPLIRFEDEEDVVAMANDTDYGLASYVYTNDLNRSWRMAEALECGIVGINEGATSTELGPFGGFKQSGLGREGSKYGVDDYLEVKFVNIGNVR